MGRKIHKPSIFQAQLKFPASGGTFALHAEHQFENIAFNTFVFVLLALVFSYIYFVGSSALNIIARKEALAKASQMEAAIGGIERAYFIASQEVTQETGLSLGLVPVSKTAYVYRPGAVGQAKVAYNEI